METKICTTCKLPKPIESFRLYNGKYRGNKCNECRHPVESDVVVEPNKLHTCIKCKKRKRRSLFKKNNRTKLGIDNTCKSCVNKYKKTVHHKYAEQHKKTCRNGTLKRKYNLTTEHYDKMFEAQKGCCEICNRPSSELKLSLFVDHNHTTNAVRGLLCPSCNRLLGLCMENKQILLNAITYLDKYDST